MAQYLIKSRFSVSVEMEVEAESEDAANSMFDSIGVVAKLYDVPDEKYEVFEDSIDEMHSVKIQTT